MMNTSQMRKAVDELLSKPNSAELLGQAILDAMQADADAAAREAVRREARVTEFQQEAKPVSRYKIITIAGRVGRRPATLFITGVSYAPGDGFKVSKISYGTDKSKAQEFSTVAAERVSEYLIRCGYTPHLDAK